MKYCVQLREFLNEKEGCDIIYRKFVKELQLSSDILLLGISASGIQQYVTG